jgi:hypothetical protein
MAAKNRPDPGTTPRPELAGSQGLADAERPEDDFLFAERHNGTPGCTNPDCGLYPYYGVAPHECFYKKGPDHTIGQSTLLPPSEWPRGFVLDLEPGEDPATVAYPNACGVYYCPDCLAGCPADAAALPRTPESGSSSPGDMK